MATDSDYLMVYGTLRQSFVNVFAQYLRQHSNYLGEGTFPGELFDLGNYPGAVFQRESQTLVRGTVYDISHYKENLLLYLDEYEGISDDYQLPHEYIRSLVPVACSGKVQACWVYLYNRSTAGKSVIYSGDYEQHRQDFGR